MTGKWKFFWSAVLCFLGWPISSLAQQRPPAAIRVLNLGSQSINAFSILGFPFRTVGFDARPGESLTPSFGDGQMDYELYWRLQDRTVHGAVIDLRKELPATFHGDVLITIHDDRAAVSWSNLDPAWIEYRRVGDPKKVPMPIVPLYLGCSGPVLSNPLTLQAWNESAERTRARVDPGRFDEETLRGACMLEWYVPRHAARNREELDEATTVRLRAEWQLAIEKYKATQPGGS